MFQISRSRSAIILAAGVFLFAFSALSVSAQNQQPPQGGDNRQPPPGGGGGMRVTTAPTKLKVLPKDTSIDQLNTYMQEWKAALGGHCSTCHSSKNEGQFGQPGGSQGPPQGQPGGNQAQAGGGQGQPQGPPSGGQGQPGGGQMGQGPPGGNPPDWDFTDDSKQQFKTARQMYTMIQEINKKYLLQAKAPVACGTCHRGHETPEAFVAQVTNQGPPPGGGQGGPQGAPQGQSAAPPAQK